MNGPHDLGGQMGLGPVAPEKDEPVFHEDWERRAFGLRLCSGAMGPWTLEEGRHAHENRHPVDYLSSTYYEIWIAGLEQLLKRYGFITERDLAEGRAVDAAPSPEFVLRAADVPTVFSSGDPSNRPAGTPARFKTGDKIVTRNFNPTGHTRLPRYARGKQGVIETVHEAYVFPDTNAHGKGESPQWLYTVVFQGREIWGEDADPTLSVSIDAWESYLTRQRPLETQAA